VFEAASLFNLLCFPLVCRVLKWHNNLKKRMPGQSDTWDIDECELKKISPMVLV
jgi:hypothetical protein